jgi:hypothetical protein
MCFTHRPTYRRAGQARLEKVELTLPATAPRLPLATSARCARRREVGTTSITPLALARRNLHARASGAEKTRAALNRTRPASRCLAGGPR